MQLGFYPEKSEFRTMAQKGNLIPVCLEVLADTETPVSALAKIYHGHGPVFLLESMEGGERWGRYSFLGNSATTSLRVYRDEVEIESENRKERIAHNGDPLKILRSLMARYKPVKLARLPRFWGGMVGFFSYEFVSFFEAIAHSLPADTPLAHFILPGELFIFDNVRHTLSLVAYALVENGEADQAYDRAVETLKRMQTKLEHNPAPFPHPGGGDFTLTSETEPGKFKADVARIKEYIREGDIIQAVYSQQFSCSTPPDPRSLYRAQRFINPSPYLYFLHFDDTILVGSSPETMVRLENGVATLRPIAGTRPRGRTEKQDRELADEMLKDEK